MSLCEGGAGEVSSISKAMFDNMARLVGEEQYPELGHTTKGRQGS